MPLLWRQGLPVATSFMTISTSVTFFLEFRYDYNMVNEDWFADQVEEVKVYVFDAEGKYLQTFIEKGNPLKIRTIVC